MNSVVEVVVEKTRSSKLDWKFCVGDVEPAKALFSGRTIYRLLFSDACGYGSI